MGLPNIVDIFSLANPSVAQMGTFMKYLAKTPPGLRTALLNNLDEAKVKQIADWSKAFTEHLNTLDVPLDAMATRRILDPEVTDNFMDVMKGTRYEGVLISEADMANANNMMTTYLKAENWKQAIMVGMSLASMLP